MKVQSLGVERSGDLDDIFSVITKERPNGLLFLSSAIMSLNAKRITEFAESNRLPSMFEDNQFVERGGLLSYGPDILDLDRRTATFVDKILKGMNPANLPVEQPSKFEFVINLKTAQQIGLTIPQSLLNRADKVIR